MNKKESIWKALPSWARSKGVLTVSYCHCRAFVKCQEQWRSFNIFTCVLAASNLNFTMIFVSSEFLLCCTGILPQGVAEAWWGGLSSDARRTLSGKFQFLVIPELQRRQQRIPQTSTGQTSEPSSSQKQRSPEQKQEIKENKMNKNDRAWIMIIQKTKPNFWMPEWQI